MKRYFKVFVHSTDEMKQSTLVVFSCYSVILLSSRGGKCIYSFSQFAAQIHDLSY